MSPAHLFLWLPSQADIINDIWSVLVKPYYNAAIQSSTGGVPGASKLIVARGTLSLGSAVRGAPVRAPVLCRSDRALVQVGSPPRRVRPDRTSS